MKQLQKCYIIGEQELFLVRAWMNWHSPFYQNICVINVIAHLHYQCRSEWAIYSLFEIFFLLAYSMLHEGPLVVNKLFGQLPSKNYVKGRRQFLKALAALVCSSLYSYSLLTFAAT